MDQLSLGYWPPYHTALYKAYSEHDELLYVGISTNWARRWKQHARNREDLYSEVTRLEIEWFYSTEEAQAAETRLIYTERPYYNSVHNPWAKGPSGA